MSIGHASRTREGHQCSLSPLTAFVNGVRIDVVTPVQLDESIASFVRCGKSHVVHFCAAHPTVLARRDHGYRAILNSGDLNVADGAPVAWAARVDSAPVARLPGTDSLHAIAEWGRERGLTHFFFGGTPDTLMRLRRNLERAHPGIKIAGADSPPFRALSNGEIEDCARRIQEAGAQALWVGLGAPKQDLVAERLRELGAAPVILCVGAAFDFVAGVKRRAPAPMRRLGLEWLHRLVSEPRRLWRRYLFGNLQFIGGILTDRVHQFTRRSR
jgi:N-acetylglucosaminyldiphosphoundecaprenol N-acetyl-beta-D-mannosaminyltransferase